MGDGTVNGGRSPFILPLTGSTGFRCSCVQTVLYTVLLAAHHTHNIATGVILQFLFCSTAALDVCAVAAQVIAELRSGLETIQLLEQTTFFIIGVCLEYMTVGRLYIATSKQAMG